MAWPGSRINSAAHTWPECGMSGFRRPGLSKENGEIVTIIADRSSLLWPEICFRDTYVSADSRNASTCVPAPQI